MLLQHLGRHDLAVEPLLQVVERRHGLVAAHQQLAVEHALEVDGLDDVGKGRRDVLAGAAVEPLHAARGGDLHADAVPFPFGAEMRRDRARRARRARWRLASIGGRKAPPRVAAGPRARRPAASRTAAGRAARGRARSPRPASTGWLPMLATACLASRAETPTRSAPVSSFSSAQRPVASSAVEPALQDRRRLHLGGALQRLDHLAERRRRPGVGIGLPDQRQRLGEVADIVVGEMEQLRPDLVLAEAAQQRGLGGGEVEPAGQRRQRPAAIGIGRLAQIGLDQPQLGVARRLVGERIEQGGEGLHQAAFLLAAGEMQRLGIDAERARHVDQRLLAAMRHPDLGRADVLRASGRARASRHGRR